MYCKLTYHLQTLDANKFTETLLTHSPSQKVRIIRHRVSWSL